MEIRIIIAGSRNFNDYKKLENTMLEIIENGVFSTIDYDSIKIISGTARGADRLGEKFAKDHGYEVYRFPANWDLYGKKAGYLRNEEMAKFAMRDGNYGVLVAFWDGTSKGTKHMINLANKHNLEVITIQY